MSINKNDEKILQLKAQIEEKKKKIVKIKRFSPITNCSLEFDGVRYNLQVLTREQLVSIMVKLNSLKMSAIDLDLLDEYTISGYSVNEWIADIKSKMDIILQREEQSKLQVLENKLHTLLSNDKKVELEIGEIESLLN